jgi:ketosteroid isomerase-like protein
MVTLHPGIDAANTQFMQAVKARDEARFVALYTEEAVLLLPGREPLQGHAGVRSFFSSFDARGVREIRLTTLELEVFGDTAWERGSSEAVGVDGAVLARAKYIVIWKQVPGGWKLHRDILNASP